jgi:membrane protein implicated in regulation of membrane protease activity
LQKILKTFDMSQFTLIWILLGISLCAVEAFFPSAFVALVAGVGALLVALVAPWLAWSQQILLWLFLSALGICVSRQFVPVRRSPQQFDAKEGRTLTEIPAGERGRVLYEGNSWSALCEDPTMTIPADTPVQIVGQKGTTLWVLPGEPSDW